MPTQKEMYRAIQLRDSEYDGLFYTAVKTTGIFCRPVCPAKTPLEKNITFFQTSRDAVAAGYRACKRCRPLEVAGRMPVWLSDLVDHFETDPGRKWKDYDIRAFGVDPKRVRRWFQKNHGITFHSFLRSRRLSSALSQLSLGDDPTHVALGAGYESLSGFREAFQNWFGATPGRAKSNLKKGPTPKKAIEPLMVNRILTLLGPMVAVADDTRLYLLEFADRRMLETQFRRLSKRTSREIVPGENETIFQTNREIEEYFQGKRRQFDVKIWVQGSEFQTKVWSQLAKIPFGTTTSYEQIAKDIGNPKACRAVGRANGDNRLSIILPCHRVIRASGEMSGYGGGVRRKEWMLAHEGSVLNSSK